MFRFNIQKHWEESVMGRMRLIAEAMREVDIEVKKRYNRLTRNNPDK